MDKPSLQIGIGNWAIKEDELLGYSTAGTRFVPQPITMTRESAGTRVNPQGLIETVELLGGELVTNGTFDTNITGWDSLGGWAFDSSQKAIHASGVSSDYLTKSGVLVVGRTYKYEVTTSGGFDGSNFIQIYSGGAHALYSNEAVQSGTFVATSTDFRIRGVSTNADIFIDNISVKESTKNNLARVDYDGTASSLLVEPQRINLMTTSEPTTTGSFKTGVVFQATHIFDWNGIYYGDNSVRRIAFFNSATTVGVDVTFSVFVKMTNGNAPTVGTSSSDDFKMYISSAITTGLTIVNIGGGIYKCSVTKSASSINSTIAIEKVVGNSANTFEVSGFQVEEGSYATSYIPTDGGTVTRNQDIFTRDGIGSLINSTEGVLFWEGSLKTGDTATSFISISSGLGLVNDNINMQFRPADGTIWWQIIVGNVTSVSKIVAMTDMFSNTKLALKWKENDFALWENGVEISTDTLGDSFPADTLNSLDLHQANGTSSAYKGKVKQLQVFKTALTDDELTILTGTSGVHFYPSYAGMASDLTYTIE